MSVLIAMPQWAVPSELWLQRMIQSLEPHVAAVATHDPPETHWSGRIPTINIPHIRRPILKKIARRLRIPVGERSKAEALRTAMQHPDVTAALVHFLPFALELEDVWAAVQKPVFVHCHGYDVTWDMRYHDAPTRKLFPASYLPSVRRLSRRVTIIANSHHTAQRLTSAGIPPERVVVKHLGVPVPLHPSIRPLRTKGIHILYLGRLIDCKGPDLVIKAFERACALGLDGRLTMAGDGPMRARCEALRQASVYAERITFLGAVDADKGSELRASADIFTAHNCLGPLSRQEEAFGVTVLEAMAEAIPVVSCRSGGLLETVVHEETGLLVTPGDVEAHAAALLRLANDPVLRWRMGEAAWQRVHNCFSIEKERTQLLDILGIHEPLIGTAPALPELTVTSAMELSR